MRDLIFNHAQPCGRRPACTLLGRGQQDICCNAVEVCSNALPVFGKSLGMLAVSTIATSPVDEKRWHVNGETVMGMQSLGGLRKANPRLFVLSRMLCIPQFLRGCIQLMLQMHNTAAKAYQLQIPFG